MPMSPDSLTWRARWWRSVEHHPNLLIGGLVLLLAPLLLLLVWLQMARWEGRQLRDAVQRANQSLDIRQQQAVIDFTLTQRSLKGLPEFMAREPRLIRALEQPQQRDRLRLATDYLAQVSGFFLVDLCLLVDATGLTLAASSDAGVQGLVGLDVSDRDYFKAAMAGRPGRQFAVGRSSSVPGLFLSAPIQSATGRTLGLAVIKTDLANLAQRMKMQGLFVEDEHGVVIMAQEADLLYRAVMGAAIHRENADFRRNLYKRTEFPLLELLPGGFAGQPEIVRLGPSYRPVLHRRLLMVEDRMALHLVEELSQIEAIQSNHLLVLWISWLGALAGLWAVSATAVFVIRGYQYRNSIEAAHAELLKLNDMLKHQAESDFLTGCMNRRRFDDELDQEISRSQRQRYPLTLALIDLDHFKRINDNHGHLVGDAALQHFADVMRAHIRQTDRFARLGGEEFALLMPDTGSEAAMLLIERLRQRVAAAPLTLEGGAPLTITASIGVSSLCLLDSHDSLFKRADHAMYAAKSAGRNRAIFSPCPLGQHEISAVPLSTSV
ncbi:MAG: hypothetical protein A2Z93_08345 [Curvibacter sp. GWA2_64_110]|nr:MAG: hypothetical protein A2Z93_08345 [Curvibacter sp. GWA2_64_110]HCY16321.1 hypothetical protein [Curvibacter sp.]